MKIGRQATIISTPSILRGSLLSRLLPALALAVIAMLVAVAALPGTAQAADSLTFDKVPTGKAITSGEAKKIGAARATGVEASRIRYSLKGPDGFAIGKKSGKVSYDGTAVSGSEIKLKVTARDKKKEVKKATATITVAVEAQAQPQEAAPQKSKAASPSLAFGSIYTYSITRGAQSDNVATLGLNQKTKGVTFTLSNAGAPFSIAKGKTQYGYEYGVISYNGNESISSGWLDITVQARKGNEVASMTVTICVLSGTKKQCEPRAVSDRLAFGSYAISEIRRGAPSVVAHLGLNKKTKGVTFTLLDAADTPFSIAKRKTEYGYEYGVISYNGGQVATGWFNISVQARKGDEVAYKTVTIYIRAE